MTDSVARKVLLLVDDDPANIHVVHSILKEDYDVLVAANGARALELAKAKTPPDLVLLDIIMPTLDGYEVCAHLKADGITREIPIIFLTGKTEVADETRGFDLGAVDYIHKPFSPPIVSARVKTHLLLRAAKEQLARQLKEINSELESAREIQMSILPSDVPHIEGLQIAARFLPASSVAGDFYDFLITGPKGLGVLVADVTGHGLPAALIASMLKVALRAQVAHASEPDRVLTGLNKALCGMFQKYFVTAAYIYVDTEESVLTYAGAGHPPLLLCGNSASSACELTHNGLVLGLFPEETYSSARVSIQSGDRIVVYTDGIVEALDASDEEYGLERLKQFLDCTRSLETDQFSEALLAELSQWSTRPEGKLQLDDITLLTIDFKGHH